FDDFRALHDKYRLKYQANGKTKSIGMGTWWLAQPGRRQYDGGMRFMPERDEDVVDEGIELLVETACNEGRVPCQHQRWPGFSDCAGQDKQRGFDYFVDHHSDHELRRLGALAVKRKLKSDWGCKTGKASRRTFGRQRTHGILWPPLPELRARFQARFGKQKWLRPLLDEWQEARADILTHGLEAVGG